MPIFGRRRDEEIVAPTREEVAAVLREVIEGGRTRESAMTWACRWILGDTRIDDPRIWHALQVLGGADLWSSDRPYLLDVEDFQDALDYLGDRTQDPKPLLGRSE